MKILVVDDSADYANAVAKLLTLAGYSDVQVAYEGGDSVQKARAMRPDVLFVDIQMYDMDGFSVAKSIRELFPDSPLKVIALTGHGQEKDREETRNAQFDHHLTKPVAFAELQQVLGSP